MAESVIESGDAGVGAGGGARAGVRVEELQVATAGHTLTRLLVRAPSSLEIDQLSSLALRASWPLRSERSEEALRRIGHGLDLARAAAEYGDLLGPGSRCADLGRALADLASACAQMSRVTDPAAAREMAEEQLALRRDRVDPLACAALAELRARAEAEPYVDLPDLVEDVLEAHAALCRRRIREAAVGSDA